MMDLQQPPDVVAAPSRPLLLLVAASMTVVPLALLAVTFWVLRDVHVDWSCGDAEPVGQGAALASFRAGAPQLHAAAALVVMMLLGWLSLARGRLVGRRRAGWPTLAALAASALYVAVALVHRDAYGPVGVVAYIAAALALFWPPLTIALGAAVVAVAAKARKPRTINLWLAVVAWLTLCVFVPAHLDFIYLRGDGPLIC